MISEMLNIQLKQKEFDVENFSSELSVKLFTRQNTQISQFVAHNKSKGGNQKKIWMPEKYNFNRKTPMNEILRNFN
jgi:hypothetical protein